jgi:acyl-CoA synthetase (AMP-forming)/AMP-acid ligase II
VNLLNEPAALTRLLESGLRQRPDRPAIVFEGRAYTYEALERGVSALAARFSAFGLAGERVGLTLPNSIDLVCCYLACFRIGAVAVPISDHYAAPELASGLDVMEPKLLVIAAASQGLLAGLKRGAFSIERIVIAGTKISLARCLVAKRHIQRAISRRSSRR